MRRKILRLIFVLKIRCKFYKTIFQLYQYYNKINAKLQSIKDKQKIERTTLRQKRITRKRNNRINDYLSKAARTIVNYCLNNDIGCLLYTSPSPRDYAASRMPSSA